MIRVNGKIEFTPREIRCLFNFVFGDEIPLGETLEDAATAVVLCIGIERLETYLAECMK